MSSGLWLPVAHPDFFAQVAPWFMALPHCKTLGLELVTAGRGKVTLKLPFKDTLIGNPETRVLHGGVVTSLIDTASGISLYTLLDQPEAAATLDLRIDYLRPAKPDLPVYCTAECYRLTESIAFMRATAYQADPDKPVAHSVSTFARMASTRESA